MTRKEEKAIVGGIINDITSEVNKTEIESAPIRIEDLNFYSNDTIDTGKINCIIFRNKGDIRMVGDKKLLLNFGNMISGYEFSIPNSVNPGSTNPIIPFKNSETAYIAGIYSKNEPICISAQEALVKCNNGLFAKKEFRYWDNEFTKNARVDWEEYNIEWMKYVIHCKCANEKFRNMLLSTSDNSLIIEDTSFQTGSKRLVWGAHNPQLLKLKKDKFKELKIRLATLNIPVRKKYKQLLFNNIYNVGEFVGSYNLMGKILTYFRICLRNGIQPEIDYKLLNSKDIYLLGQKLVFE